MSTCRREGLTPVPDLKVLALDCEKHGLIGLIPEGASPTEYDAAEAAFQVHKNAVAQSSPLFEAMFKSDMTATPGLLLHPSAVAILGRHTSWPTTLGNQDRRAEALARLREIGMGPRRSDEVIKYVVNPLLDIIVTLHAQLDIQRGKS